MKAEQIFGILASAALAGWFAPDLDLVRESSASSSVATPRTDAAHSDYAAQGPSTWQTGKTVLKRQRDGHFYADVVVENGNYRFLVDTGASVVALTGEDAQAMGLFWDENSVRPIGRGANGMVYGVPTTIPVMEMGGIEARNVDAAIIPEGLGISLLGQSFLSRISNVSISGDEMQLGD